MRIDGINRTYYGFFRTATVELNWIRFAKRLLPNDSCQTQVWTDYRVFYPSKQGL